MYTDVLQRHALLWKQHIGIRVCRIFAGMTVRANLKGRIMEDKDRAEVHRPIAEERSLSMTRQRSIVGTYLVQGE